MTAIDELIQAERVERIVRLFPGCIYKRLKPKGSYDEAKFFYGRVLDVVNNGSKTAVTTLEAEGRYSSADTAIHTFQGDEELEFFPVSAEEFMAYIEEMERSADNGIRQRERELATALRVRNEVDRLRKDLDNGLIPTAMTLSERADA